MVSITRTDIISQSIDDIINDISDLLPHINNITALSKLLSPDSVDIYVMGNLRNCNDIFSEVTEMDNDTLKKDALTLLPTMESVGYMMSLPLLPGDYRILSVKDITLTVNKFTVPENADLTVSLQEGDVYLSLGASDNVDQSEMVMVIIQYDNIDNLLPGAFNNLGTLRSVAVFGGNFENKLDMVDEGQLDIIFPAITTSIENVEPQCQYIVQDGNLFR